MTRRLALVMLAAVTSQHAAHRIPFALAALMALGFLAVSLATTPWQAASAGDELVAGASPFLTDDGLGRIRADLELMGTTFAAISTDPTFAADARQDPALTDAAGRLPEIAALADKVVSNLEQRQGAFESASALPGFGLDLVGATIAMLIAVGVVLVAGVLGALHPVRWVGGAILVVGLAVGAAPLLLGHLQKAQDTDDLLDSLRPFSAEKVEAREGGLADVRTVFEAYDGTTVTAADLALTDAAIDRFAALVEFSRYAQPRLVEATPRTATSTVWMTTALGGALAAAGAAGIVTSGRRRHA